VWGGGWGEGGGGGYRRKVEEAISKIVVGWEGEGVGGRGSGDSGWWAEGGWEGKWGWRGACGGRVGGGIHEADRGISRIKLLVGVAEGPCWTLAPPPQCIHLNVMTQTPTMQPPKHTHAHPPPTLHTHTHPPPPHLAPLAVLRKHHGQLRPEQRPPDGACQQRRAARHKHLCGWEGGPKRGERVDTWKEEAVRM
jgi:hypothetical protein